MYLASISIVPLLLTLCPVALAQNPAEVLLRATTACASIKNKISTASQLYNAGVFP